MKKSLLVFIMIYATQPMIAADTCKNPATYKTVSDSDLEDVCIRSTTPTYRRFTLNKLVRDNQVTIHDKQNVKTEYTVLADDKDYLSALYDKLTEELDEVFASKDRDELISEIGDLEEVLDAVKAVHAIDKDEVTKVRAKKNKEKGAFGKRIFIHYIDIPASAKNLTRYCVERPEKYPEVICRK